MQKVYVGLSGGVDSAVTAYLLQQQGYDVTCVFIHTWSPDWMECGWKQDRRDAMRVAIHLGLPFVDFDAVDAYRARVAQYMIDEYKQCRTPNPDVMCNDQVKFGVFYDWARTQGADYIATGHYAQSRSGKLYRGSDPSKDQSYFLWMLQPEKLQHILFPIGHLHKTTVREIANKAGLPVASKKDSQGVCFLGHIDMAEFLSHYADDVSGAVLDVSGNVIGQHTGCIALTLGQTTGFQVTYKTSADREKYEIVAKDLHAHTVTVVPFSQREQYTDTLSLVVVLHSARLRRAVDSNGQLYCNIRYHGEALNCTIVLFDTRQNQLTLQLDKPELLAPGQSVVLYVGDECLGGGIV